MAGARTGAATGPTRLTGVSMAVCWWDMTGVTVGAAPVTDARTMVAAGPAAETAGTATGVVAVATSTAGVVTT